MHRHKPVEMIMTVDWGTQSPIKKATLFLSDLYKKANPKFPYVQRIHRDGQIVTTPSLGVQNDGLDNSEGDYIFHIGDLITPDLDEPEGRTRRQKARDKQLKADSPPKSKSMYLVEAKLGQGSFGQVLRCLNLVDYSAVAIKVIKNKPAYTKQAALEIKILEMIRKNDPDNERHCVHILESFRFHGHMCHVTELLGDSLYAMLKEGKSRGFSLDLTSTIIAQVVDVCALLSSLRIIHCDIKPDNILVDRTLPAIKVIDFGSSVFAEKTLYTYIQSRYYRAPEVILGNKYTPQIDMWSVGCVAAELFLGKPIFPGSSEFDQLRRIHEMVGPIPSTLMENGRNRLKYCVEEDKGWRIKTEQEYQQFDSSVPPRRHHTFVKDTISHTITAYSAQLLKDNSESERGKADTRAFVDFLQRTLVVDAKERLTPNQALAHPFLTKEPFSSSWQPPHDPQFNFDDEEPAVHTETTPEKKKSRNPFSSVLSKIKNPFSRRDALRKRSLAAHSFSSPITEHSTLPLPAADNPSPQDVYVTSTPPNFHLDEGDCEAKTTKIAGS
ncbi:putative serine/threonine protein kinase [Blattamonas nauphoetae]|uniref:Serine/threonine protein kinase n=1 Tax=Blattamonas nauphoetae TaxID=2049346 RepID=A0ABQ9XFW8_9EUKA|nr:putative serine/threonine protein kinase [Blattamonas nauphoetae]